MDPPYLRVIRACELKVAPPEIEAFHDLAGPRRYVGQAQIDRGGQHPVARLICRLAGYPSAGGGAVPVKVTLTRRTKARSGRGSSEPHHALDPLDLAG